MATPPIARDEDRGSGALTLPRMARDVLPLATASSSRRDSIASLTASSAPARSCLSEAAYLQEQRQDFWDGGGVLLRAKVEEEEEGVISEWRFDDANVIDVESDVTLERPVSEGDATAVTVGLAWTLVAWATTLGVMVFVFGKLVSVEGTSAAVAVASAVFPGDPCTSSEIPDTNIQDSEEDAIIWCKAPEVDL